MIAVIRVHAPVDPPVEWHLLLSARPKVADLVFHLYGRTLHPELFDVQCTRAVDRGGYSASVSITTAGHVVRWKAGDLTLTEVAGAANQPLPQKRRLISYRLSGERSDRMECRGGGSYQMSFQLERVDPEVFWSFQGELAAEGQRHGLLHRFGADSRVALGALSWINVDVRGRGLLVQAFHTFPEDHAIVKSQSLFELP